MAEGGGQEGFFWASYPWVMSNKSSGGSGFGDKNLIDLSKGNNHCEMKQPKMGDIGDSSGGDQEVVATTVDSANKRTFDDFKIKKENDVKVSSPNDKGKRELEPNDHDLHIWTERERRKKMRNMFHQLHALIPELPPKVPNLLSLFYIFTTPFVFNLLLDLFSNSNNEPNRGFKIFEVFWGYV